MSTPAIVLYSRVRVEPTDASFLDAIEFARASACDAYAAGAAVATHISKGDARDVPLGQTET